MAGLTDEGFVARRQPEIQARIEERLAADDELAGLNLRAGPMQQLIGILSEELAEPWEAAEEVWASQYAGASGVSLDRVSGLTGTVRRAASRSLVVIDCDLAGGTTLPAGRIVARDDDPDVQFRSVSEVTNSGGDATIGVTFESVATGPVAAPTGTLTVIVTPITGWTAATNAADASLGRERAEDPELRTQRRVELAGLGTGNVAAIRAAVARVEGDLPDERPVREVSVYENATMSTVAGRPPKSVEVVIWDAVTADADDDKVAQAIWDHIGAGIEPHGVGESGVAVDEDTGEEHTVAFTRATPIQVYVDATVVLVSGTAATWQAAAKETIAEHSQTAYRVGHTAYAMQLACALLERAEIEEVVELFVGIAASPTGSSVAIGEDEIATVDTANITLAEA